MIHIPPNYRCWGFSHDQQLLSGYSESFSASLRGNMNSSWQYSSILSRFSCDIPDKAVQSLARGYLGTYREEVRDWNITDIAIMDTLDQGTIALIFTRPFQISERQSAKRVACSSVKENPHRPRTAGLDPSRLVVMHLGCFVTGFGGSPEKWAILEGVLTA